MGFLNGIGDAIQGAAQTAVKASPYVANVLAQRKQAEERDRQTALAQLYQQNQDRRAEMNTTLQQAVGLANIGHLNAETTKLQQPIPPVKNIMRGPGGQLVDMTDPQNPRNVGPAPVPKAPSQPIVGSKEWQDAERFKASLRPTPQQTFTPFQGTDESGKPVVRPFNTKTGQFGPVADVGPKAAASGPGGAQMASKAGQFGEMLKKTPDLFASLDGLDVGYKNSAAQDIAEHGVGVGPIRIPGTKGIGNAILNNSPQYAKYQAALEPWVLSAAHAMSGARINQDQATMIRRSVERGMNDAPETRAQKDKNMIDQLNSIAASLPPDQVAAQEAQLPPAVIETLRSRGYRSPIANGTGRSGAPSIGGESKTSKPNKATNKDYGIFGTPPGGEE